MIANLWGNVLHCWSPRLAHYMTCTRCVLAVTLMTTVQAPLFINAHSQVMRTSDTRGSLQQQGFQNTLQLRCHSNMISVYCTEKERFSCVWEHFRLSSDCITTGLYPNGWRPSWDCGLYEHVQARMREQTMTETSGLLFIVLICVGESSAKDVCH